jgi:hypothetical protein
VAIPTFTETQEAMTMKTFDVVVRATVTKTVRVEAENEDDAYVFANESFSILNDGSDEDYTQEALEISEVTE